jgi:hypothetical protein
MAVTETELRRVITKLDDVKLELLRLRAVLLPQEQATAKERKVIEQGRLEIQKRHYVALVSFKKRSVRNSPV